MNNNEDALFQIRAEHAQKLFAIALKNPHGDYCDRHYPEIVDTLKKAGVDWKGGPGYEILGVRKVVFDGLCFAKAAYLWDKALRKKDTTFSGLDSGPEEGFALENCLENLKLTGVDLDVPESWAPIGTTPEDFRKECSQAASRIGAHFSSLMAQADLSQNVGANDNGSYAVWADLYEKMVAGAGEDIGNDDVHKSHGLQSAKHYRALRRDAYKIMIKFHFQTAQDSGKDDLERNLAFYLTGRRIEEAGFDDDGKRGLYAWLGTTREEFERDLAQATAELIPPPFDEQVPAAPALGI